MIKDFPKLVLDLKQYHKAMEDLLAAEVKYNQLKGFRNNLIEAIAKGIDLEPTVTTDDRIIREAHCAIGAAVITAYDPKTNIIQLNFKEKTK